MNLEASLSIGAPEVVLAIGTLVLLMLGVFRGDRSLRGLSWGAVLLFAMAAVALLDKAPDRALAWNDLYVADAFSHFLKALLLVAAAAAVLLAIPYLERVRAARFEYPVLIVLGTLGMFIMVSANNLLTLYVGLELMSLSSYVLASFHRTDERSTEAGLKYFVLGSLASGLLLYGVSLVYGFVGSIGFDVIAAHLSSKTAGIGGIIGMVFVICGLGFKLSSVPFHMWTPDVYEGAPTPVTTYFASAPKVAAMGLLLRLTMGAFGGMVAEWQQLIIAMSVLSMYVGAVGAIGQRNIKRLLAYSSINNVGVMFVGFAAATQNGVSSVLLYLLIYIVMMIGAFLCVLLMTDADGRPVETLDDMAGLARHRPWLAAAMAVFMFSLAGVPPLFGFMGKLAVFMAAVEANLIVLAVLGVIASVIAAYYYLSVVKVMFLDRSADVVEPVGGSGVVVNGSMITAAALFCSPLGFLLLGPITDATQRAAAALVAG